MAIWSLISEYKYFQHPWPRKIFRYFKKMSTRKLTFMTEEELNKKSMTIEKIRRALIDAGISVEDLQLKQDYITRYLDAQKSPVTLTTDPELFEKIYSYADINKFFLAASDGKVEKVKQYLAKNIPIDFQDPWGRTALIKAADHNQSEVVKDRRINDGRRA